MVEKFLEKCVWWLWAANTPRRYRIYRVSLILFAYALTPVAIFLAVARIRFVTGGNLLNRIGHLAIEPGLHIKSARLGWGPRYHAILLAPTGQTVNPCLLNYWEKYFRVITNRVLVSLLRPLERNPFLSYSIDQAGLPDGQTAKAAPACFQIQARYEEEFGDEPLLKLSESDFIRGWSRLRELGVPQGSWFVCLHGRESGYLPDHTYSSFHDVEINTYLLAVEAIVQRGGWVIRMGDPSMKPLPQMDQVIDYVHSDIRSDWMDVFCFSQCRFLLGSASGAFDVPFLFGVPVALANYAPMGVGPYSRNDLWIPKMYWSASKDRFLTFDEVLLSPLRQIRMTEEIDPAGFSFVDNSPEEIRDLAVEMLDKIDGKLRCTEEDRILQGRFKSLLESDPVWATVAPLGRDFLRSHSSLFGPQELSAKKRVFPANSATHNDTSHSR